MPTYIRWYECDWCGKQFDTWSDAEVCEFTHEYEKEQTA
jgi:predicted nucleic acid-binding Zn ribbon protein